MSGRNNKKRSKEDEGQTQSKRGPGQDYQEQPIEEEIEYEDPFEDQFDSDDNEDMMQLNIQDKMDMEDEDEDEEDVEDNMNAMDVKESSNSKKSKSAKRNNNDGDKEKKTFNPVVDRSKLAPGEELEYDPSAYEMFHSMSTEWPCLSFDVVPDKLGIARTKYPHTTYLVAGTQAEKREQNKIVVLKMTNMTKTRNEDDSSDEDEDDDENESTLHDVDPELNSLSITHDGAINRIRCMPQAPHVVATWSEEGFVSLWSIDQQLKWLDSKTAMQMPKSAGSLFKLPGHKTEGFAMDWSSSKSGRLVTGDCSSKIFLTDMREDGTFQQDPTAFNGHKDSVEDLQWSPTEETVFASCSVDKTIKIWDVREKKHQPAISWEAGSTDVNVMSWGRKTVYLLVAGSDDGALRVWDLRSLKGKANDCSCVAHFKWHKSPITSVQWDPNDESVFAAASEDDSITIWDLSTERDEEELEEEDLVDIPPQLLFIHQNQTDVKEIRYHQQIPSVLMSTAIEGFDIFKPNLTEQEQMEADDDEDD